MHAVLSKLGVLCAAWGGVTAGYSPTGMRCSCQHNLYLDEGNIAHEARLALMLLYLETRRSTTRLCFSCFDIGCWLAYRWLLASGKQNRNHHLFLRDARQLPRCARRESSTTAGKMQWERQLASMLPAVFLADAATSLSYLKRLASRPGLAAARPRGGQA